MTPETRTPQSEVPPPAPEVRKLSPSSWLFMAAGSIRGLIVPALLAIFATGGGLLARLDLLSLIFIVPAVGSALIRQAVYNYRFAHDELVVRQGVLTKKERHIPYDRIHNIALVQNPFHRMLGVATARVETAAGGKPEAVMRVLSLEAVEELRHTTLGRRRATAASGTGVASDELGASAGEAAATGVLGTDEASGGEVPDSVGVAGARTAAELDSGKETILLRLPVSELVRLGLISNRGFIVLAAAMGFLSQMMWWGGDEVWDRDWAADLQATREHIPDWVIWLAGPGSFIVWVVFVIAFVLVFLVLLRLFSMAWYLVKYYDFNLQQEGEDLRTEYGMFTRVSSLIPVHRIQLLTMRASFLHRWFGRASIDLETAGASEAGSDLSEQLAASGVKTQRQWLAPIIETERGNELLREVMPEIDLAAVEWKPIEARAVRRIVKKVALVVGIATIGLMAMLFSPSIPVHGLHGLWLPVVAMPVAYFITREWVRRAGYAISDDAIFYRSGWLTRKISVVRFDKMQTVAMRESPFDRRNRMASVAVDTAGAGNIGHRVDIPYLDIGVARAMSDRLYAEASASEFRW